jgi:hypothetical protein
MAPQKDNFGLRQALERRGLTSIMLFGNPDSPEGAQGYRPGQWDPTYDETRTAANEYLTGFKNSAFPDGVRNGGRFQVPGGGLNVITDVHVDIGEDGFPSVKSFSFSDPKGEEYTYHLDAQVEGQDEPQSIVTPRMKPGPSASSFAGNRKSTGPLHTELRGPMPDPGFLAKAAGEVRMAAGAVKDKIYDGAALLFGEKSGTIESKTLPSPPSWSEQQLRTFHDTGRLPSGASWDDVFYPKFTPITNEKGETIGYHQPGELRAPLEYKPWMRSETNVEEAFKRDGLIGGMFAMRNPYTLTKDIIHNLPMPGGNGKYDTIGNRAAGAIGLEQRLPGKGLPRIGEGNATPQQHLFQPQYIAPSDSGLATGLKGAYNVGTGVANVLYSIPEFMHSGTGYAVQGIGTKLQSAKAAIPQAMMQTGAASPQTAAAVNTARKWVAADTAAQGMFIKHMGEATIDAGKNVVEQIRQGDYANLTSSLPDLLASGIFTGQIIKHTAGNIPQLSHGGMHRVGVDAGMQQVVDSNMSAIDRNFAQTPDVVREADMRTAFGDVFNAEAYGPGGVPISPIVYGRNNAGVAGLPQQPITTANGQVIYQPQEGDLTSGSRLDLRNLAKPEGKPVELSPAAAKLMKEGEELTAKEAAERIQRSSADEAERARVLAELEKQGFTAEQKAKDDVELGDYLKRIDEERLKLFQETGHYYHPDELLAATSGGRAGGGPRPVEPGKGGAGRRPNSPVEIAAENKRRQDLINNGINPDTNQPMAKPGTLPADALTGPRGTATMAPDATAARPGLAPEGVTNIESQRNAAGTMDVPTARLPEVHSSMFSGPAGRNLIDTAAAELGLPRPTESVDTGFWSEGGVLQNNGASAFRFTLQPGSDMADAMRRVGRFATSLSAAHGQKGVGWSVIRHDIQPDVKGNYPDYKGENQMGTAIQVDAGRKLNRPETIAFSKEVERILKADYNIDAAGSVGPMSHEGGVRMFDFMGSVPDKMALAEASRKAWENTIGRDSGHNATVRLIAYEGKYEQQEGWDSEFKPGTFGGRYGQVLGLGTDAGISPRLRRAIDAATRERNEQTKLYSGHGGKRGTQFHPQTGQPLDSTGSRVVATPLALTGDRQLSTPVRPVLPQSNAEQVPLTAGYGRSSPRLPGSSQSRAAIPAAEANQAARDVGRFRELDNPDARLGGGQTAAQAPLSRGLSDTLRQTSSRGDNLTLEVLSENESLDGAVRGNNPGVPTRMNTVHLLLRSDKDIPVPPTQTGRPDYTGMSNLFRGEAGRRVATEIIGQIQTTKNGEPEVYIERFDTHPGMRNQGMLKGLLSEFVHRINNEADAQGMTRMSYRLSDVSDLSASSKALAAIVGPENITINVRGIGDMPYTEWRKKFDSDVLRRAENERAEAKSFDDVLQAGEDFQAGRITEQQRDAIYAAHYDASTRLEADSTLPYRSSRGASGYSMLGNRSLQGDSLENQIADHYQRIEEAKGKLERGEGNPNRIRAELDMLGDDLQDLLREQDKQAGLSTFDAKPAEAPVETSNVPRWEQPMPTHLRPGTPAYNREIMERHHAKMDSMKMSGNQARLLPPKAEVELMGLRRLMRDVSDGKVSTGEATEAIQRSIEKLVDRTSVSKERGLAELRNIQGIDQQFLDMAARKFDEREARKNQASQPAPQGGTTGRDRVRDPLAKPQVWERRQERTGPEALTETGDPSRLTYDELVDLQTRLEKNKGSADPDLLRSVTEEMQNRHRQYGNEGERNTALGGFVPETTPKSQLNDMVRSLPDQIRSDRERLSELNKRDGRNRSPEAAQLATEIKVNEERLRAAKVELNARGRQQGNWERLDRTRIVQRERDKQTFDNPDNPGPRVKRDPVQALNWARGRFDRLTIDELMQARDALKEQGRPYWREVEKAINERRKAMPEMRREEGRTTDIVPENMTRPELDAEVDRLSTEIEANDARVSEMQAAGASAAEIEAVRAEVDPQRGRLSEFQAEVENRDRIETTDFRRENEKQIGGHQQFRNEMAGRRKKLDIVSRVEGRENQPGQFFQEEARYYGLSAGARDVVNMTFRGNTKVKDVLERIVKNSKSKDKQGIDPELGKLAEYLLKNQDAKSLEVIVGAWGKNSGEASGYMAGWRPEAGNIQGGNKYGGIKFSKEQLSNPKHALEIVMHEIVHSATADKVNRAIFGTVGVITGDTGIDVVGSSGTKYLDRLRAYAQSSGSDKAVRRLVQTYLKVLSEQKDNSKPLSVDKLNNLKDDPRNATRNIFGAGSDMNRLAAAGQYPIADLNEFIAHASTNAEFKAYLKTIKMGETNAWSKFKQAVKEIMGIEGGTALDVAMESILEISAKNISDFKKPDGEYYSQLFDIRSQRKQAEGMSPSDADAATAAEIHPRGFDEFGVGKQSLTRGIKDAEADIEELTNRTKGRQMTREETREMNDLLQEHEGYKEAYEQKFENNKDFLQAKKDLEAELGREATHDEVIQEMDFRETMSEPGEYNYRQFERDRKRETRGKSEQELMDRLREEPGMEGKLPKEEPLDPDFEAELAKEAATSMGLEKDTLEALGIITREERRSSGEFAPGSFERRDELYQGFVELGGDTDVRSSSEIPADVQRAFKERYGFEYKPEDVDTLGEPRLGNKDIKGLEGGTNGFRMSSNKSFLREEAQASINVVKKGIEGLKRAKENITDKETFLQHGVDFATASFLRSSQAQLDVLADRRQSKVIREVSELLNSTLAGRTDKAAKIGFHTAVSRSQLQFKNELADALRPFESELKLKDVDGQKQFLEDLGRAMVQPGLPSDPKLAQAVTSLRGLYRKMHQYQIRAGIKLDNAGETYVPRMLNNEMVLKDRYGFLNAAQKAYETTGMDPIEAREAASEWYDAILRGDSGFSFDQKFVFDSSNLNGEPKHTRSRKFNKVAEGFMEKYYNRNILDATTSYIGRAVKNAEIARRFGAEFEVYQGLQKALISEGNRTALQEMNSLVANQLGTNQLKDYKGQGIINFLNAYSAIHFLPRATLSSIGEPLVTGLRTGNVVDSLSAMGNSLVYMKRKLLKDDPDYYHKLAQDVGVVVSELSGQAVSSSVDSRYWTDQTRSASKYLTDQFFRKTGLHQWTEGTRIASVRAGTVFLRRLAEDINDNGRMKASSARYLNELGVTDHASFAKFVKQLEKLDDAGRLALISRQNGKGPQMYRDALARFAEQVIMNPNAGTRPRWANHPLGSVIFNLQSYLYAFHENVTKRALRLAKTAVSKNELTAMDRMHMLGPAMMLPVLTGVQYLMGEARDEAFKDPARVNEAKMSEGMKIARAMSRSNLFGRFDFMANAALSARYDKDPATVMLGPVLGTFSEGIKGGVDYLGPRNSKNTNTAERRFARLGYDLAVQPAANAAFALGPGKIMGGMGAIGIQATSHPATREYVVKGLAGKPAKPQKRNDEEDDNIIDELLK